MASLIIRGLYVLDGIKDYTLIVLGVPFRHFFASSFIVNTFYVMKNVLIGYQLREIGELLTHQKKWSSVDLAEKFFFAAVLFLVVFSFTATAVFTVWANRRMRGNPNQEMETIKGHAHSHSPSKNIEITTRSGSNLISRCNDLEA